jgi:hypothetical protein
VSDFQDKEWQNCGDKVQLLLDMDVELPNSKLKNMKILVDTGAQINLVKRGLIPPSLWQRARNPVRLITANNSVLGGGDYVVNLGFF